MKYLYKIFSKNPNKSFLFKIVLTFLLLSELTALFIVYVNNLKYKESLKSTALSHVISLRTEKESSLYKWILDNQNQSLRIINSGDLRQKLTNLSKLKNDVEYNNNIKELTSILDAKLDANISKTSKIESISIVDISGKIVLSVENKSIPKRQEIDKNIFNNIDLSINTNKSFTDTEQKFYSPDSKSNYNFKYFYFSFKNNMPVIVFVNPIFDELGNRAVNVLVNVKIGQIEQILDMPSGANFKGEAYLIGKVNNQPVLVAGNLSEMQESNQPLNSLAIETVIKGQSGNSEYKNYADTYVIGSYNWTSDLDLALIVEINQQYALSPANLAFRDISLIVTGLVILMTAVCYGLIRYNFQSVLDITNVALSIADGNLDERFPTNQKDEIGALAIAFNHLLNRLQEIQQDIFKSSELFLPQTHQGSEILQHLIDNTNEGVALLDNQNFIVQINSNLADILSISIEEAIGKSFKDILPLEIANLITSMQTQDQRTSLSEFTIPYQSTYKVLISTILPNNNYNQVDYLGTLILISDSCKQEIYTPSPTNFNLSISKEVSSKILTPLTSLLGFLKLTHKKFQDSIFNNFSTADSKTQRVLKQIGSNFEIMISEGTQIARSIGDIFPEENENILNNGSAENINTFLMSELLKQVKQETEAVFTENNCDISLVLEQTSTLVNGNYEEIKHVLISLFNRVAIFNEFHFVICQCKIINNQVVVNIGKVNSLLPREQIFSIVNHVYVLTSKNKSDQEMSKGIGLIFPQKILQKYRGKISVQWVVRNRERYQFYVVTFDK